MIEWMDALRSKLRELGILTPRDNLYSKEPEGYLKSPLLRNPNSPLPPTPTPHFLFPPPSGMDFRGKYKENINTFPQYSPIANIQ